jgi:hypothetical protein
MRFETDVGATAALWETRLRASARRATGAARITDVVISTALRDAVHRLLESD